MRLRIGLVYLFITLSTYCFGSKNQRAAHHNIKFIHTLKDKKGNLLGRVYIEDFKKNVFRKLLITKISRGKTDTLYFINNCIFRNPKGVDISVYEKTFAGYKIELLNDDSIQLFSVGKGSTGASDPAVIAWNYKKKIFEVDQTLQ